MTPMDVRRQIIEVRILELEAKKKYLKNLHYNNDSKQEDIVQAQIAALHLELNAVLEVQRIVADIMMEEELNGQDDD